MLPIAIRANSESSPSHVHA